VGGLEVEGSNRLAGALEEVEGSGLEGEGDGLGEVDAGVFEMAVDEERYGEEAGAGGWGGGDGVVGLGVEGLDAECGDEDEAADEVPEVHACDGRRGGCAELSGN